MNNNQPNIAWDKLLQGLEKDQANGDLSADEQELLKELQAIKAETYELLEGYQDFDTANELIRVKNRIYPAIAKPGRRTIKMWTRIGIAAALVTIVVGIGLTYFFNVKKVTTTGDHMAADAVIMPGKQGATLTLANGKKIVLSEALNGELAKEAGVVITKSANGQLIYEVKGADQKTNKTNTLSTAKGENYAVRLPDGSMVYLNAASSLTYPASFAKHSERRVLLSGEGYFEISKDKAHPFIVESGQQEVEVLGTHFNINAYTDEESVKTTLLEGSVKVTSAAGLSNTIQPGQQIRLQQGKMDVLTVDPEEAIAWKNGLFYFNDADLKSVMRQLSRWYDVEIRYKGEIPSRKFSGQISKNINAAQLMEILSFKKIQYTISNKTILIK